MPQSSVALKAEGLEVRVTMQAALNTDWHVERKQTSKQQLLALQDCATVSISAEPIQEAGKLLPQRKNGLLLASARDCNVSLRRPWSIGLSC